MKSTPLPSELVGLVLDHGVELDCREGPFNYSRCKRHDRARLLIRLFKELTSTLLERESLVVVLVNANAGEGGVPHVAFAIDSTVGLAGAAIWGHDEGYVLEGFYRFSPDSFIEDESLKKIFPTWPFEVDGEEAAICLACGWW